MTEMTPGDTPDITPQTTTGGPDANVHQASAPQLRNNPEPASTGPGTPGPDTGPGPVPYDPPKPTLRGVPNVSQEVLDRYSGDTAEAPFAKKGEPQMPATDFRDSPTRVPPPKGGTPAGSGGVPVVEASASVAAPESAPATATMIPHTNSPKTETSTTRQPGESTTGSRDTTTTAPSGESRTGQSDGTSTTLPADNSRAAATASADAPARTRQAEPRGASGSEVAEPRTQVKARTGAPAQAKVATPGPYDTVGGIVAAASKAPATEADGAAGEYFQPGERPASWTSRGDSSEIRAAAKGSPAAVDLASGKAPPGTKFEEHLVPEPGGGPALVKEKVLVNDRPDEKTGGGEPNEPGGSGGGGGEPSGPDGAGDARTQNVVGGVGYIPLDEHVAGRIASGEVASHITEEDAPRGLAPAPPATEKTVSQERFVCILPPVPPNGREASGKGAQSKARGTTVGSPGPGDLTPGNNTRGRESSGKEKAATADNQFSGLFGRIEQASPQAAGQPAKVTVGSETLGTGYTVEVAATQERTDQPTNQIKFTATPSGENARPTSFILEQTQDGLVLSYLDRAAVVAADQARAAGVEPKSIPMITSRDPAEINQALSSIELAIAGGSMERQAAQAALAASQARSASPILDYRVSQDVAAQIASTAKTGLAAERLREQIGAGSHSADTRQNTPAARAQTVFVSTATGAPSELPPKDSVGYRLLQMPQSRTQERSRVHSTAQGKLGRLLNEASAKLQQLEADLKASLEKATYPEIAAATIAAMTAIAQTNDLDQKRNYRDHYLRVMPERYQDPRIVRARFDELRGFAGISVDYQTAQQQWTELSTQAAATVAARNAQQSEQLAPDAQGAASDGSAQQAQQDAQPKGKPKKEQAADAPVTTEGKQDQEAERIAAAGGTTIKVEALKAAYSPTYFDGMAPGTKEVYIRNIQTAAAKADPEDRIIGSFVNSDGLTPDNVQKLAVYAHLAEDLGYDVGDFTYHSDAQTALAPITKAKDSSVPAVDKNTTGAAGTQEQAEGATQQAKPEGETAAQESELTGVALGLKQMSDMMKGKTQFRTDRHGSSVAAALSVRDRFNPKADGEIFKKILEHATPDDIATVTADVRHMLAGQSSFENKMWILNNYLTGMPQEHQDPELVQVRYRGLMGIAEITLAEQAAIRAGEKPAESREPTEAQVAKAHERLVNKVLRKIKLGIATQIDIKTLEMFDRARLDQITQDAVDPVTWGIMEEARKMNVREHLEDIGIPSDKMPLDRQMPIETQALALQDAAERRYIDPRYWPGDVWGAIRTFVEAKALEDDLHKRLPTFKQRQEQARGQGNGKAPDTTGSGRPKEPARTGGGGGFNDTMDDVWRDPDQKKPPHTGGNGGGNDGNGGGGGGDRNGGDDGPRRRRGEDHSGQGSNDGGGSYNGERRRHRRGGRRRERAERRGAEEPQLRLRDLRKIRKMVKQQKMWELLIREDWANHPIKCALGLSRKKKMYETQLALHKIAMAEQIPFAMRFAARMLFL